MIEIRGIQIDFDITAPSDIQRYTEAGEQMQAKAGEITLPDLSPDDPAFFSNYVEMLNIQLRIFGDFIDTTFGDGIAAQLLGKKPSLNEIFAINDEIGSVLEKQGKDLGAKIKKYTPNRATRRKK